MIVETCPWLSVVREVIGVVDPTGNVVAITLVKALPLLSVPVVEKLKSELCVGKISEIPEDAGI